MTDDVCTACGAVKFNGACPACLVAKTGARIHDPLLIEARNAEHGYDEWKSWKSFEYEERQVAIRIAEETNTSYKLVQLMHGIRSDKDWRTPHGCIKEPNDGDRFELALAVVTQPSFNFAEPLFWNGEPFDAKQVYDSFGGVHPDPYFTK